MYRTKPSQKLLQKICCWIGILILVLSIHLQAFAEEPFRINTIFLPPLGFLIDGEQPAGLFYDISTRIADVAGLPYTNQVVPFARAITELERGEADMSIFFRREGDSRLVPLAPVYTVRNIAIGRQGTEFDSLDALHGKRVAKGRRTHYGEAFENDLAIDKFETDSVKQTLEMLMNNRVDAVVAPELTIFFTAKELGYAREDFGVPLEISRRDAWVQVSASGVDESTRAALKAAIEALLADGTIQQIITKYLDE